MHPQYLSSLTIVLVLRLILEVSVGVCGVTLTIRKEVTIKHTEKSKSRVCIYIYF